MLSRAPILRQFPPNAVAWNAHFSLWPRPDHCIPVLVLNGARRASASLRPRLPQTVYPQVRPAAARRLLGPFSVLKQASGNRSGSICRTASNDVIAAILMFVAQLLAGALILLISQWIGLQSAGVAPRHEVIPQLASS
jgi:hypothetical protein